MNFCNKLECLPLASRVKCLLVSPEPTSMKFFLDDTLSGRLLALPTKIILVLKGLKRRNTSLLRKFVNYGRKKFYNIWPWSAPLLLANIRLGWKGLQGQPLRLITKQGTLTEGKKG
jgi:hypothetical protein